MIEIQRTWKERRDVLNKARVKRSMERAQERENKLIAEGVSIEPASTSNRVYCSSKRFGQKKNEHGKWEWIEKVVDGPDVCQKCKFDFGTKNIRIEGRSDTLQFFINVQDNAVWSDLAESMVHPATDPYTCE